MKRLIIIYLFLMCRLMQAIGQPASAPAHASRTAQSSKSAQATQSLPRPKLVVGIAVDQMRWDYLYRYYSR